VLVDGHARVACVTPARRVAGREITTLDGLPAEVSDRWAAAFCDAGASQCGFCTPGIIVRLAALAERTGPLGVEDVEQALLAHLCRCTGWRTIVEAAIAASTSKPAHPTSPRDLEVAARRASIEGHVPQRSGPSVALGRAGFADDFSPGDALVAVPDGAGGWIVGGTLASARAAAGKVQGRRSPLRPGHPLALPDGDWALTLRTTWVEPAYLELDASWCLPGGEPASPLANGGAFGAKQPSVAPEVARTLAAQHGRPVRVVVSREDAVRLGAKRPPIAAGLRPDGTGVLRVVRTPGVADAVRLLAPGLVVEEVDVPGPPTSAALRGAGWVEAAVLMAGLGWQQRGEGVRVRSPWGAWARAEVGSDGVLAVEVACGPVLDEVVLRSYCIGAAHQALSWVTSEAIAVDETGAVHDLTVRSFGILRARDTPRIDVTLAEGGPDQPVNGSDAVFAAVAAAVWVERGLAPAWPTDRGRSR